MDKIAIRNFAIEARKILMKSAITEAGFYGITKDGCKDPVQKGNDFEVYETVAGTENRIFGDDIKRRANLVQAIKTLGFEQVIEETAYTWFNRIIAIRFMEVNNYLPTRVRVLSSETGSGTPDIITQADTVELNLTSDELEKIQTAKRENRYDDAFRMLFIKQCNELNAILPGLFEKTDDYMELLLKITYTGDGVIRMLVDSIPEDNFNVETEGQVEIIGWMYQYYNTELKDDTFAKLKKNVKITKERIPAATQLFTPDWIVRYMVENSLGRVWIDHLRAVNSSVDEKAKAEEFGWQYYLPEAEQDDEVQAQLVEIRKSYKDLAPQDITCIDPCMGSGHILVYMFDVLMDIYRSEGFSEREAVFDILEKNIRGLDIDRRAYQLSYFALMMKARGYNRIFFRGHDDISGHRVQAFPKVYAIEESNAVDRSVLQYYGAGLDELQKNKAINQMNGLLDTLVDAKEYGSVLNVDNYDWNLLRDFLAQIKDEGQESLFGYMARQSYSVLTRLVDEGELLASKYDAVVTNPPYMGASGMNDALSNYIKAYYPDSKSDLFSVFIEKASKIVCNCGYTALITMESWMFLSSFEKLRRSMFKEKSLINMVHMPYLGKGGTSLGINFGTTAFVLRDGKTRNYNSQFEYTVYYETDEQGVPYVFPTINERWKSARVEEFECIPGCPVAYWISKAMFDTFLNPKIEAYASTNNGFTTGNNNKFLRLWFEVDSRRIDYGRKSIEDAKNSKAKWFPYNKGGDYRKWYGNNDFVINWENDGEEIKAYGHLVPRSMKYQFKESCSWNKITSATTAFRYKPEGTMFDVAGLSLFSNEKEDVYFFLGLCNSIYVRKCLEVISPTLNCETGHVAALPVARCDKDEVIRLVKECIQLSKEDWDSFESSSDFARHPLVAAAYEHKSENTLISSLFDRWKEQSEERFEHLKRNEEALNKIFISAYGLERELDYEVDENEVSVRKADRRRDICSLISYAVGCMFGRYSLDKAGLICASNDFDSSNYSAYSADKDAIIPITDEEYFEDDVVDRFVKFIELVFGQNTLEENLRYIADSIETKGETSREKLRFYFLQNFYKDHCSTYSVTGSGKRPIYWMFDSGKENGFKCLVYLHRYNEDTVGIIRSDYLTKTQTMIENALKNAEYAISTSSSAVDRALATKKRDKYIKQLAEIRAYYPALSHIALQRVKLNLDDGVKANYAKFQGIEVSVEGEKKQKIDLLAKI